MIDDEDIIETDSAEPTDEELESVEDDTDDETEF